MLLFVCVGECVKGAECADIRQLLHASNELLVVENFERHQSVSNYLINKLATGP